MRLPLYNIMQWTWHADTKFFRISSDAMTNMQMCFQTYSQHRSEWHQTGGRTGKQQAPIYWSNCLRIPAWQTLVNSGSFLRWILARKDMNFPVKDFLLCSSIAFTVQEKQTLDFFRKDDKTCLVMRSLNDWYTNIWYFVYGCKKQWK